jgi:hypothetical protein
VRLEGLGQLKKKIHLIGTRTRDLPACSIVPEPTTLPRAPQLYLYKIEINEMTTVRNIFDLIYDELLCKFMNMSVNISYET